MSRLAGRMPNGLAPASRLAAAGAGHRPACLALRHVPARFASTEDNKPRASGPSFKGQLTHSIMNRLQRERADLTRMAQTRPENRMARNFSLTFGAHSPLDIPISCQFAS